jgi:hypothetical protein
MDQSVDEADRSLSPSYHSATNRLQQFLAEKAPGHTERELYSILKSFFLSRESASPRPSVKPVQEAESKRPQLLSFGVDEN